MRSAHAEALELVDDLFQIAPRVALAIRCTEKERRVKRRHHLNPAKLVKSAAQGADRCTRLEQRLRRRPPERDDEAWRQCLDLTVEEWKTLRHFVRLRIAVGRRPA